MSAATTHREEHGGIRRRASRWLFAAALTAFVAAGLADMVTFAMIPASTVPHTEMNPLARVGGLAGIVLPKIVLFGGVGTTLALWRWVGFPRTVMSALLLVFAVLGMLATWTNVAWGWTYR